MTWCRNCPSSRCPHRSMCSSSGRVIRVFRPRARLPRRDSHAGARGRPHRRRLFGPQRRPGGLQPEAVIRRAEFAARQRARVRHLPRRARGDCVFAIARDAASWIAIGRSAAVSTARTRRVISSTWRTIAAISRRVSSSASPSCRAAEQHREIASDFYHGGCVYHDDASVDPMKLLLALMRPRAGTAGRGAGSVPGRGDSRFQRHGIRGSDLPRRDRGAQGADRHQRIFGSAVAVGTAAASFPSAAIKFAPSRSERIWCAS